MSLTRDLELGSPAEFFTASEVYGGVLVFFFFFIKLRREFSLSSFAQLYYHTYLLVGKIRNHRCLTPRHPAGVVAKGEITGNYNELSCKEEKEAGDCANHQPTYICTW